MIQKNRKYVRGISDSVWQEAKVAAAIAGKTLGQWLVEAINSKINTKEK